jgi:hypothetical protein
MDSCNSTLFLSHRRIGRSSRILVQRIKLRFICCHCLDVCAGCRCSVNSSAVALAPWPRLLLKRPEHGDPRGIDINDFPNRKSGRLARSAGGLGVVFSCSGFGGIPWNEFHRRLHLYFTVRGEERNEVGRAFRDRGRRGWIVLLAWIALHGVRGLKYGSTGVSQKCGNISN